jgi:hypothetical protein
MSLSTFNSFQKLQSLELFNNNLIEKYHSDSEYDYIVEEKEYIITSAKQLKRRKSFNDFTNKKLNIGYSDNIKNLYKMIHNYYIGRIGTHK